MSQVFSFPFRLQNDYIFDLTLDNIDIPNVKSYCPILYLNAIPIKMGHVFTSAEGYTLHPSSAGIDETNKYLDKYIDVSYFENIVIPVPGTSKIFIHHLPPDSNIDDIGYSKGERSVIINYANQSVLLRYTHDTNGPQNFCNMKLDKYGTLHIDAENYEERQDYDGTYTKVSVDGRMYERKQIGELVNISGLTLTKHK